MAKKMTIAERKAELEKQMMELDVLEDVQTKVNEWIEQCDREIHGVFTYSEKVGESEEHATNYQGELLYTIPDDWRRYTESKLVQMGKMDVAIPAHDPIYEERTKSEDELWAYEKKELTKWRKLKALLQNLEV